MNRNGEIRSLTGMRGVAAVLVMAYHYRNIGSPSHTMPSQLGPCYLMVDMFFILSGFVMARTYAGGFSGGFTWRGYAAFLEARVARVYPLYFVATLVMFVLVLLLGLDYPLKPVHALLANLFLVQNLGVGLVCATCSQKLVLPGWSISTEAAAYLLFPAFAAVALFRSRSRAILLLVAAAGCMVLLASLPFSWLDALERRGPLDISEGTTLWPLLRCLAGFGIGVVLWRAARTGYRPTQAQAGTLDVVLAVALAGLWFLPGSDLALVVMLSVLIWHLAVSETLLTRCLASPLPYRLGEWSYAIYLLHWPVLMGMTLIFTPLHAAHMPHAWGVTQALLVGLTMVFAASAHAFIERPARRELRALFHRRARSMAAEPGAP